jgi:hypothetical protein
LLFSSSLVFVLSCAAESAFFAEAGFFTVVFFLAVVFFGADTAFSAALASFFETTLEIAPFENSILVLSSTLTTTASSLTERTVPRIPPIVTTLSPLPVH